MYPNLLVSVPMQFRKDVNGLRAIAVIAVVLFHFNASWMPGGFAGVDVFFVISGFLMTGIIFRGIEQENFSILSFYLARAKRIVPALATLCLALLLFGIFFLSPDNQYALSKHILGSLSFISNIIYWDEGGYFNAISLEKWLLHTWSLSIEWQFYILYPLLLVAMRTAMTVKAMKVAVLLCTILGFIFCVIATYKWPNPAYYLLPTRVWELTIGGVAYLYPFTVLEKRKRLIEWLGLALIVGSCFLISKENFWPGYLALFPVLGAFLMIQAQRNDSFITSNIVFQKIGAWSYSIYLWHWPLVVAIYHFSLDETFIYLGLILSVGIGSISYKHVEIRSVRPLTSISILSVVLASLALFYTSNSYVTNRDYVDYLSPNENSKFCKDVETFCESYGSESEKDFIVWGDSHSIELGKYLGTKGYDFVVYSTGGCPPINKVRRADGLGNAGNCDTKINDDIFDKLSKSKGIKNLVLIGRWSLYNYGWLKNGKLQAATHFICFDDCKNTDSSKSFQSFKVGLTTTLSKLDEKYNIFLFEGSPILKVNGIEYSGRADQKLSLSEHNTYNNPTDEVLEDLADTNGYSMLSYNNLLFEGGYLVVRYNEKLLFKDDNHLTYFGWDYVFTSLSKQFNTMRLKQGAFLD